MRRFLRPRMAALLVLLAAGAPAQTLLDCGVAKAATIPAASNQFYNVPNGAVGDAMLVRVLYTGTDPAFKVGVLLTDPVNRVVASRTTITQPGQTPPPAEPITKGAATALIYDLAFNGTHQIRIQNLGASEGSYRLVFTWLNKPCTASGTLACGGSATKEVVEPLQLDTYQFAARKDDIVSARLRRIGTAGEGFRATLVAYSPKGQRIAPLTGTATSIDTSSGGFGRLDFRAPGDGLMTLVVFDAGNSTGTYAVAAALLNRSCGTAALGCGAVLAGQIGGRLAMNSFTMEKIGGDVVSIRIAVADGSAVVPALEVYDTQGNAVALSAAKLPVAARTVNTWTFTATSDEPYTLLVKDASSLQSGGYSIARVLLNRTCGGAGTLGCGTIEDGSMGGLLAAKTYSLAANANDVFLLRLLNTTPSGVFRPQLDIYDARGNNIQTLTGGDLARATFTTRAGGSYTVVVSDGFDNSQNGSYTISLLRLNGPCAATGALSCGAVVAGNLSHALEAGVYTYDAAAGQSFTVRMIDDTGGLQEALEVYDAQGNLVGQNGSNPFAGVDVTKATGGVYTILALDTSRRQTGGRFGIDLLQTTNACAAPAPQGATVSGVVSAGRPFATYRITAKAGDPLLVRSASFTAGFSAQMDLYDPAGSRVDSANFGLSRKAEVSGTYTVVVGGSAPRTAGAYALSWQLLNSPAGTAPLACGGSTAGLLGAGSEFRYYTANAAAGDIMRLIFTRLSDNFSPQVELYDPAGGRLPASSTDITQKAGADGDYLVLVGPAGANAESGTYSLAYQRPNRPCNAQTLTCGQTSLRTVSLPGQLDTWSFSGTAGDQASVRLTPRSGAYVPFGELYDGAGNRVATSGSTGLLRAVLPAAGPYTVLARDLNAVNTGTYRASLQDDTNACTVSDTEPPAIVLVEPTGGDVIAGGSSYRIQWQSDDNVGVAGHTVELSSDGGTTFGTTLAAGLGGNQQSYDWTVPPDIAPSRNAVIRVTATDGAGNAEAAASGPVSIIGSGFQPNRTTTLTYDGWNRVTQSAGDDGRMIEYTWDAAGNLVQITISGQP